MKRKHNDAEAANGKINPKKRAISDDEARQNFRKGLFDPDVLKEYTSQYSTAKPYKHGVIQNLIEPSLLRAVRDEILRSISFTPKETDIYKIHQSGDLANLDGLDDSSLRLLPSLVTLRDALYSSAFRKYISTIADSGPLSGVKTDMAVNVYTPGCHLLCHDDVIGSRRVSYILYLLDPDRTWKPEWGGALRLYPTDSFTNEDGAEVKVPSAEFSVSIPPLFNQLAFFVVTPGESFHDVEEVYHRRPGDGDDDGGRVRMAISGWFHIPQEGEEGYEEGLEEKLAERSSLQQLQSKADEFDLPQPQWIVAQEQDEAEPDLSAEDLQFLLQFMNPQYLVPDTVEQLSAQFEDTSCLRLSELLSPAFSTRLRSFLESVDKDTNTLPSSPSAPANSTGVARPPHKHRFLYRQPSLNPSEGPSSNDRTPYDELIDIFMPSPAFRRWLGLATGLTLSRANILARRFRRGVDYTLATSYEEDEPRLEMCLGITPSRGWGEDEEEDDGDDGEAEDDESENEIPARAESSKAAAKAANGSSNAKGRGEAKEDPSAAADEPVGGYEMYMAADEEDEEEAESKEGENPSGSTHTGAGKRRKADPAVYRSGGDDEDDGVLFSMPATWNNMSIVLRDRGILKFVKYVSRKANGDRWDISGEFAVEGLNDDEDE